MGLERRRGQKLLGPPSIVLEDNLPSDEDTHTPTCVPSPLVEELVQGIDSKDDSSLSESSNVDSPLSGAEDIVECGDKGVMNIVIPDREV